MCKSCYAFSSESACIKHRASGKNNVGDKEIKFCVCSLEPSQFLKGNCKTDQRILMRILMQPQNTLCVHSQDNQVKPTTVALLNLPSLAENVNEAVPHCGNGNGSLHGAESESCKLNHKTR